MVTVMVIDRAKYDARKLDLTISIVDVAPADHARPAFTFLTQTFLYTRTIISFSQQIDRKSTCTSHITRVEQLLANLPATINSARSALHQLDL